MLLRPLALMGCLVFLPLALRADIAGTITLQSGQSMNFDTGAAAASGGDMLWNGATLTPQGSAKALFFGIAGAGGYAAVTPGFLANFPQSGYSSATVPSSNLATDAVILVKTNGGHNAKMLVTSNSGGSLAFQFTTFGATAPANGPTITQILNNYSFIPAGLPNSGIAEGSIFVIVGSGLSGVTSPVLQDSSKAGGLPTTLNQTSLSVTVSNTTTTPTLYYVFDKAVAAIMPTGTPAGTGTLKLDFNGQTTTAPITVVSSALGLDTLYGIGTGAGTVTDANFNVIQFNNPAKPNQPVILWGSGIGPDPNNDDRTFPQNLDNLTNIATIAWVGGMQAKIDYRGRSQFPGLDQIVIEIPGGITGGCFVPIVIQQGNILSNTVTTSVSSDGGPCTDPSLGYSASTFTSLAGKTNVNSGFLSVAQDTTSTGLVSTSALATFRRYPAGQFGSGYGLISQGQCVVVPPAPSGGVFPGTALDPGVITETSAGQTLTLNSIASIAGFFETSLPAGAITGTGGTVSFNGAGGADVGKFSTSVSLQSPLAWTNKASISNIDRTKGVTVTWTGGFPNSNVQISGLSSVAVNGTSVTVQFTCQAPASALQFTIPPSVLLALPAAPGGDLNLSNSTVPVTFTATGLDYGFLQGSVGFDSSVAYQ